MSTTGDLWIDSPSARQREWLSFFQARDEQGGSLEAYAVDSERAVGTG